MKAESPTAATIFCAAAAEETSSATIKRSRASFLARSFLARSLLPKNSLRWRSPSFGMRLGRAAAIPVSIGVLRELRYGGMVVGDRLVKGLLLARLDQIQTNTLQTAMAELQGLRGAIRQID